MGVRLEEEGGLARPAARAGDGPRFDVSMLAMDPEVVANGSLVDDSIFEVAAVRQCFVPCQAANGGTIEALN